MGTLSSCVTPGLPPSPRVDNRAPRLGWLLIVLLAAAAAIGVAYIAIYFGVEYGIPPWAARLYPPPLAR